MVSVTQNVAYIFSPNVYVQIKARICEELNIMVESISNKVSWSSFRGGLDRMNNFVYLIGGHY
jgi:hypothetical protein